MGDFRDFTALSLGFPSLGEVSQLIRDVEGDTQ
jgi:hypothetical protein